MIKIGLDAGHGLYTAGKETADKKYKEWTLNNNVANYIEDYLKQYNVEVIRLDDKTGNIDVPLEKRLNKAVSNDVDAIVSVHHNAYKGEFGNHSGVEVYVYPSANEKSRKLANEIVPKLAKYTGLKNRGVKVNNFYMISLNKNIPQVLTEGGFMDSNVDYPVITSINGQKQYAKAVADSLVDVLNLQANTGPDEVEGEKMIVTANVLNIRENPSIDSKIVGKVYINEVYTIIDKQNNFGLLKSRVGWISLDYLKPLYSSKYTGNSIVEALNSIGVDSSFANRAKIAKLNGINNYTGTAQQNTMLLNLFKSGNLKY